MIQLLEQTLNLAKRAIEDVEEVLGPPGKMNPYNVPQAAEMLGTYAVLFSAPDKALHKLADIMSEAQSALIITKTK